MKRRTLLALPLLPLAARIAAAQPKLSPLPLSAQDRADVARVEAYLGGMRSLKARFLQVAPDGSVSQGTAWIERPGRMRFQYDPPSPLLLVASHGEVIFQDKQLGQFSHIDITLTPLGILLADNIRLSGDVTVTAITRLPGQLQVTLIRTGKAGDGSITLVFADNPLALKQWSVLDAQQNETRVSLFGIELGGKFDQKLFEFVDPKRNVDGGR
jgi:outer membrane lipoprotein-sorting protein